MSKYNSTLVHRAALLIETDGRGEGADFVALGGNLKRENVKTAIAIFDSLERAPWWEEVKVGYEFQPGEPGRYESDRGVSERATPGGHLPIIAAERGTFFRDTRWQPPVKPLEVGDVIDTVEQAESLPVGTIAVTRGNVAIRKVSIGEWRRGIDARGLLLVDFEMAGQSDRIIYLPRGDSE